MITKARKYLRLLVVLLGASISAQMEYRANFLVNLIGSLAASGGALFGLGVVYGGSTTVGGWSYREAVVVVGLFVLIDGFTGAFLFPNLNRIADSVRLGTMDFTLMKPIDGQFLISAREINVFRLVDVLVGLGLTVWALAGLPHVSASDLLLGLGLLISALAIVYAICFMLSVTAFWFVNVANVIELFYGLFRAGQFPITAFPAVYLCNPGGLHHHSAIGGAGGSRQPGRLARRGGPRHGAADSIAPLLALRGRQLHQRQLLTLRHGLGRHAAHPPHLQSLPSGFSRRIAATVAARSAPRSPSAARAP